MMCQACEEGRHWDCCMKTSCDCDCAGSDSEYDWESDEYSDFEEET